MADVLDCKGIVLSIGQWLMKNYWGPMYKAVEANPSLLKTLPGFLLKPEKLVYYLSRTHIGIEYLGPERIDSLPGAGTLQAVVLDYSKKNCHILDEIVGFDYEGGAIRIPLLPETYDLVLPTNTGADELDRLQWNWTAQDMLLGFNSAGVEVPKGQFTRLINARFFDSDSTAGLKTRHIKWLDLIPCEYDDSGLEVDSFKICLEPYFKLVQSDLSAYYPLPKDFRIGRLQQMNRFVEFIGDKSHSEPEITRLLARDDLQFALKMRFSAKEIYPEHLCEWQSEKRAAIKPDFFIVGPDGYADIVEFKLPDLGGSVVVGSTNRQAFSAVINSYIAQTRVYRDYFDDPNNRAHIKAKYGINVYKPKRHLVVGRRWNFESPEWRAIAADFPDLTIHTYDDLIDGVVVQFYD